MKTGNLIKVAFKSIGKNRMRSSLATLGMKDVVKLEKESLLLKHISPVIRTSKQVIAEGENWQTDIIETASSVTGFLTLLLGAIAGVSLFAGGIGILAGLTVVLDPFIIIASFVFSGAVGGFFGFYPARKPSRMNPIDALHYE